METVHLRLKVQWLLIHKQNSQNAAKKLYLPGRVVLFLDPFGVILEYPKILIGLDNFNGIAAGDGGQGVSAKCQQCTLGCGARNLEETPQWQGGCDFPPWCLYAWIYWLPGFKRAEVQELRQRRWEERGRDHLLKTALFACQLFSFPT